MSSRPSERKKHATALLALPAILVACLALWACNEKSQPNVLLISLDACRAGHLGSYGYARDTSPFLDELAGGGTRFANAFINTLGTAPSHTTILSSAYQEWHRVNYIPKRNSKDGKQRRKRRRVVAKIPADAVMLQETLAEHGYTTLAATAGGNFGTGHGFDRGFDRFSSRSRNVSQVTAKLLSLIERKAPAGAPIFAVLHTYEIHSDYDPPDGYRTMFGTFASDFEPTSRNLLDVYADAATALSDEDVAQIISLYDGEIRYVDDTLRSFFNDLAEIGFLDDALVIVTSDHGEEFIDHGHVLHQGFLYDELMKIPLFVSGNRVPARVDDRMVSSIDIAPTVLDYVGVRVPETMRGRSLLGPETEAANDDAVFAQFRDRRYAVRTREWKLIANSEPARIELFDLVNDPREQNNVADRHPDIVSSLASRIEEFKARNQPPQRQDSEQLLDEQEIERLKALGYLGGT